MPKFMLYVNTFGLWESSRKMWFVYFTNLSQLANAWFRFQCDGFLELENKCFHFECWLLSSRYYWKWYWFFIAVTKSVETLYCIHCLKQNPCFTVNTDRFGGNIMMFFDWIFFFDYVLSFQQNVPSSYRRKCSSIQKVAWNSECHSSNGRWRTWCHFQSHIFGHFGWQFQVNI